MTIVFHAAATVRFDEKLSLAMSINVEGVKSTLELCKRMKNLKVSTDYYIHTYIHTYVHTHIHTYLHTYIHTQIHPYVRTFIHTYIN